MHILIVKASLVVLLKQDIWKCFLGVSVIVDKRELWDIAICNKSGLLDIANHLIYDPQKSKWTTFVKNMKFPFDRLFHDLRMDN